MARRCWPAWLLGGAVLASGALGCSHTEDEWQAKLREVDELRAQVGAEQRKAQGEVEAARARKDEIELQLKAAGLDLAKLDANVDEQARALEEHRRRAEQRERLRGFQKALFSKLEPLRRDGVHVALRANRVVVRFDDEALFEPNRDGLKKGGEDLLRKAADVLRADQGLSARAFQVACHVESASPASGRPKDAWAQTLGRAREVLVFLLKPTAKSGGGLSPARWSAAGYGDTDPLEPNDSAKGKRANRRCELVLLPNLEEGLSLEASPG